MSDKFGLVGTVTFDWISQVNQPAWKGLGGVLYQGAVLCAAGKDVYLYTNLGSLLVSEMNRITKDWKTLYRRGINQVTGPGNQVELHYPQEGERKEVLKSVVPPIPPYQIIEDLPELKMLILVINSGFDIELRDWQTIVQAASCPIWVDIHSLALSKELGRPRQYRPLPEWTNWMEGVDFLQANAKEMAAMLGHPDQEPTAEEMLNLAKKAFELGSKAIFVTHGKAGVLVMTPGESKKIPSPAEGEVVDSTGCGDVFCAGTAVKLTEGNDPFEAAEFGLRLASKATTARGVEEIYNRIRL
jgi:hypothetical protein